jgi:F420-non-reducing hydrogenase iron-sulfur subunit
MSKFVPKILTFACNWCSYAGADLAGISRKQYPSNIRIIRVMCSGRVEPIFVLSAFEKGADGVLITGCHLGDCHYKSGNNNAEIMVKNTKELLSTLGLGSDRLRLEWISASEGQKFAEMVKEFTQTLQDLGPNPASIDSQGVEK